MAKERRVYKCSNCAAEYPRDMGKCNECGEYGTVKEVRSTSSKSASVGIKGTLQAANVISPARRVKDIDTKNHRHTPTGISELDRTLGGGLVAGQVILMSGEPGVGKALSIETNLITPKGLVKMGDIQVGDILIDLNGNHTNVIAVTEIMSDRSCYNILFSNDRQVVADAEHFWYVQNSKERRKEQGFKIKTTQEIFDSQDYFGRYDDHLPPVGGIYQGPSYEIEDIIKIASVPVRCVQVDSPDHSYLIEGNMPTHNSTLLLDAAQKYAAKGNTVLYISGEESAEQITLRARRIGADADTLLIADETDINVIIGQIEMADPDLVVIDSVQTVASPDVEGRAGGVSQVAEVAAVLTKVAKGRHMPMFLVGQITKDGNIGGPQLLSHLVDTVLFFEGDRNTSLRILRSIKNRFGPADEVSCYEQTEDGIKQVEDPSGLFRTLREAPVAGTCITVTMEGRRALLAEVQALVAPTNAPNPRRGVSGLDTQRMAMLVAVSERHGKVRLFDKDTYLATVAGMKIVEPAADLAVCLAIVSANNDIPIPSDIAAIGEVTLSGDIRRAPNMPQRLNEAERLGFKRIIVPMGTEKPKGSGLTLINIAHITKAFSLINQFGSN
jgi:DNA repair protein RadA/Sms